MPHLVTNILFFHCFTDCSRALFIFLSICLDFLLLQCHWCFSDWQALFISLFHTFLGETEQQDFTVAGSSVKSPLPAPTPTSQVRNEPAVSSRRSAVQNTPVNETFSKLYNISHLDRLAAIRLFYLLPCSVSIILPIVQTTIGHQQHNNSECIC